MSKNIGSERVLELIISQKKADIGLEVVIKALGSHTRLEILRFLASKPCSVHDIARALDIPPSTAALHINILERAGLIETNLQPARRGVRKICARTVDRVVLLLSSSLIYWIGQLVTRI